MSRKEAAAGIETDGRRKEIADERTVSAEKSGPFLIYRILSIKILSRAPVLVL